MMQMFDDDDDDGDCYMYCHYMRHWHFRFTSHFKWVVSIDFEFTSDYKYMKGYKPGHPAIIQIGMVAIETEKLLYHCKTVSYDSFSSLVNPGPHYWGFYWDPEGGYRSNGGVSIDDVEDKQTLDEIWPAVLRWLEAVCQPPICLVAYGGYITDFKLLQDEIGRYNLRPFQRTSLRDEVWVVDSKKVIDSIEEGHEKTIAGRADGNYTFYHYDKYAQTL